jgi:hypothetical protein
MTNLYYVQQVGPNLVMLSPVGGGHPDHGLPGSPGHPDQGLPGGPLYPSHGLPGMPPHVSNRPPGSGNPAFPDNTLPSVPPPVVLPGYTVVMIRTADMKWHYAVVKPGQAPIQPLPEPIPPGGIPDQGLPPQPPVATQPPFPGQLPSGPPTAQPKPA